MSFSILGGIFYIYHDIYVIVFRINILGQYEAIKHTYADFWG